MTGEIDYQVFVLAWWLDLTEKGREDGGKNFYRYPKSNRADLNDLLSKGWKLACDREEWIQEGEYGVVVLKLYKEKSE